MRPSPDVPESDLFECFDCGARAEAPDSRSCPACGGRLRNLGVERER